MDKTESKKIRSIHFVGVKGVGMTPLAIIAKQAKIQVSGSDVADEFITDEPLRQAGITPFVGFSKDHVKNCDLVITTGAHGGFENVEVLYAKAKGIPILTHGEAVGYFMSGKPFKRNFTGISVTGTHGKTTTTAMIATLLQKAGFDPSYVIGTSSIFSLPGPGRFGKGNYFVAEGDEYATEPIYDKTAKFIWQHPKFAVVTNIELDHPDVYESEEHMRQAFLQFVNNLPGNGFLITCIDDAQVRKLVKEYSGNVITYGFSKDSEFCLTSVRVSGTQTFFHLARQGFSMGEFVINVIGEHNALNTTATVIVGMQLGISLERIKKLLLEFKGSKRRLEYIGESKNGLLIFDDYAHHPTEIKKTLHALRQVYPKSKIVCIFQPHMYSRTKKLFDDFLHSFLDVNEVILMNIYSSLREGIDPSVSSQMLVEAMKRFHPNSTFLPNPQDVVKYIAKKYPRGSVIVTMGAGDVYKISEFLKYG